MVILKITRPVSQAVYEVLVKTAREAEDIYDFRLRVAHHLPEGFYIYVGRRHVAVHPHVPTTETPYAGSRLAIVTNM